MMSQRSFPTCVGPALPDTEPARTRAGDGAGLCQVDYKAWLTKTHAFLRVRRCANGRGGLGSEADHGRLTAGAGLGLHPC